jgi:hypothetical protein
LISEVTLNCNIVVINILVIYLLDTSSNNGYEEIFYLSA